LLSTTTPISGVTLAQKPGQANAFVGVRGRHADVRHHHIGVAFLDGVEQRVEVGAGGHHLDVLLSGK
jgi:hypothetical protein